MTQTLVGRLRGAFAAAHAGPAIPAALAAPSAPPKPEAVANVFPKMERAPDQEDCVASSSSSTNQFCLAMRFFADDGGRFIIKASGSGNNVEMCLVVGDGGLPPGFVDDLNEYSFELDFATDYTSALSSLLAKAASLYKKMNRSDMECLNMRTDDAKGENHTSPSSDTKDDGAMLNRSMSNIAPRLLCRAVADANNAHANNAQANKTDGARNLSQIVAQMAESAEATVLKRPNYSAPDFSPSPLATATLTKQLSLLASVDTKTLGFEVTPVEDNLYIWKAKLYFSGADTLLATDLEKHPDYDSVHLEFRFPNGYPCQPPFCRIVGPAFCPGTGYVQPRGGLCMELLTGAGWTPANSMESVCLQIASYLQAGKGRIDLASPERVANYTFEGALRDMAAIVKSHGWSALGARSSASRKRARLDRSLQG